LDITTPIANTDTTVGRFDSGTFADIAVALDPGENRSEFIRKAVRAELERRRAEAQRRRARQAVECLIG